MITPDFSELNSFIDIWGLDSAHSRLLKRATADLSELNTFYEAVSLRLDEIIEFLNQFPIDDIPDEFKPLSYMTLAICEVDDAIHMWRTPELDYISAPTSWRTKTNYYDYK